MSFVLWNVITIVAILIATAAVLSVRRLGNRELLKDSHAVTDPMMATVGMLVAILLGFMVANAMSRYEEARLNVQEESGAVGDLFRLARGLPDPTKHKMMVDCLAYIDSVSQDEWPLMASEKMNDKTWSIYADLWKDVSTYEPQTQGQSNLHQIIVGCMTQLGECRRARGAQIQSHMPTVLWYVVGIGAFLTVSFTLFFGLDSGLLQILMTALLTYVLFMNIYLLISFNQPFNGDVRISPTAFEVDRILFRKILNENVK